MSTSLLSAAEKDEIFSHQHDNGPFSALALETACLNYLDRLNRTFRNPLAAPLLIDGWLMCSDFEALVKLFL